MSVEAIKKIAKSSKVLITIIFAVALTVALKLGLVDSTWYQDTMANAYYMLMGGYSVVEVARAIAAGRVSAVKEASALAILGGPGAALSSMDEEETDPGDVKEEKLE
jgi:hypothetical protein